MPIYEYKCQACGYKFEELQKISDPELTICPHCQQPKLGKLVSNTSFQLKGSGWYVTDFKDKKSEKPVSTTKPTVNDTKASETKAESSKTEVTKSTTENQKTGKPD